MASMMVLVPAAQGRVVPLSGYPAEQGNPDVTRPQQGNQNVRRGNALGGVSKQLLQGTFIGGMP
jgi:hypothetical protein